MARRIGIDLESFLGFGVCGALQQGRPQPDDLVVSRRQSIDMQVEMDLLRCAVRPPRRHMVRGQLHGHPRFVADHNRVPLCPGNARVSTGQSTTGSLGTVVIL